MLKPKFETIVALFLGAQFFLVLVFMHKELGAIGCGILSFGLFVCGMYVENSYVRATWMNRGKR